MNPTITNLERAINRATVYQSYYSELDGFECEHFLHQNDALFVEAVASLKDFVSCEFDRLAVDLLPPDEGYSVCMVRYEPVEGWHARATITTSAEGRCFVSIELTELID